MYKQYIIICLLVSFTNAQDVPSDAEELNPIEQPKDVSSNIQVETGRNLETGKSFAGSVPYPPRQAGLGPGYGYIPPQGQFYPSPGPYQPYPYQQQLPYFGGGYPNIPGGTYQRPPYYFPNYLQSYDLLYGRRAD